MSCFLSFQGALDIIVNDALSCCHFYLTLPCIVAPACCDKEKDDSTNEDKSINKGVYFEVRTLYCRDLYAVWCMWVQAQLKFAMGIIVGGDEVAKEAVAEVHKIAAFVQLRDKDVTVAMNIILCIALWCDGVDIVVNHDRQIWHGRPDRFALLTGDHAMILCVAAITVRKCELRQKLLIIFWPKGDVRDGRIRDRIKVCVRLDAFSICENVS